MKKTWIVAGCAVLSLSLAGCGANNNAARDDNNQGPQVMNNQDRPGTFNNNNRNGNGTLTISERAEKQVEKMKEVEDAHVIISENNAYVTVRMNNNNANNNNNRENNGNARVNDMDQNGGGFIENGTVNPDRNKGTADDGVIDGQGDAGSGDRQNAAGGNRNNNTIFGNTTGGNNAAMGGSTTGHGGSAAGAGNAGGNGNTGDTNAGDTGATNYSEVSSKFEQKIADQVRQADKRIHKVFVSVDPDLYNRMGTFADDIRTNRNRDGLFDNFNTTMNDFFGGRNQR